MTPTPHASSASPARLWAPQAWLDGRWQPQVLLEVAPDGRWARVEAHRPCPPAEEATVQVLPGPVLPGLVNAHSHAFQRAFVGLAERREGAHDDFWSWRDRMYGVALRLSPDALREVATHLYRELLAGGFTQVCEFHYLHHDTDGTPYDDPLAMAWALADAAQATGIGLTLLPVVYERSGFAAAGLRPDQRRFACTGAQALAMAEALRAARRPGVTAGVALHSLRAATPASIRAVAEQAGDVPLHIHVAEQTAEIDDCLQHTGRRPVQWLAAEGLLDARWHLVHATHTTPAEIEAVAQAGAGVVLCPGTEANLGDGLPDLPGWLAAGVPWTVGTDSHVTRTWPDELRWLEYGQRLVLRRRNVAADPEGGQPATAARLFHAAAGGGAAAAGVPGVGRLAAGARADLLVLNTNDAALQSVPHDHALDAVVFASPTRPFRAVMVAGRWVSL